MIQKKKNRRVSSHRNGFHLWKRESTFEQSEDECKDIPNSVSGHSWWNAHATLVSRFKSEDEYKCNPNSVSGTSILDGMRFLNSQEKCFSGHSNCFVGFEASK